VSDSNQRDDDDDLIPDPQVADEEFNVCLRTLSRWDDKPELGFPPPIYINGRKYRKRGSIREFKRRAAVAFAANPNRGAADAGDQAA
jgi:hypothetical protein